MYRQPDRGHCICYFEAFHVNGLAFNRRGRKNVCVELKSKTKLRWLASISSPPVIKNLSLKNRKHMKISYEIKVADCLAFNDHHLKTSPFMQKTIRKGQMWWAAGPLIGGLAIAIFKNLSPEKTLATLSALSLVLSMPMFFLFPAYFKMKTRKNIESLFKENGSQGVLGLHDIEITDDGLIETSECSENEIQFESIGKIVSTADYTFAYIDENTAHIIPKKNIVNGDYAQFVDKLNETFKRARANPKTNRTENTSALK